MLVEISIFWLVFALVLHILLTINFSVAGWLFMRSILPRSSLYAAWYYVSRGWLYALWVSVPTAIALFFTDNVPDLVLILTIR